MPSTPDTGRAAAPGCAICRARKVKCDGRLNGCSNCERLQLNCDLDPGGSHQSADSGQDEPPQTAGVKRKRTYRSCTECRTAKVKCDGGRPACSRCQKRSTNCVYDADSAPIWTKKVADLNPVYISTDPQEEGEHQHNQTAQGPTVLPLRALEQNGAPELPQPPVIPQLTRSAPPASSYRQGVPEPLMWLYSPELPSKSRIHRLLEEYFNNIHPIRSFAFVHKPSFLRRFNEDQLLTDTDHAMVYIMCALGARFYALEYSQSVAALRPDVIRSAGRAWVKEAESLIFTDYGNISLQRLMATVLVHDFQARSWDYARSFLLSGPIIRMAHALQINSETTRDVLCRDESNPAEAAVEKESRRRLMWACYVVDMWAGSGVDQLTLLRERDLKTQLPCTERRFLLKLPCVTELLQPGKTLDFIPSADVPPNTLDNMGISAFYIRIVALWKRVLRFVKHLDTTEPPWHANSEFATLKGDIRAWKENLPMHLDFTPDNMYVHRESSELGALVLLHCIYHHVICDCSRISLPELFRERHAYRFPSEQQIFMQRLQQTCFESAQRVSAIFHSALKHGVKYLADPMLPAFAYNSNRILLHHIARILDTSRRETDPIIRSTMECVQSNNEALRAMSLLDPLAEPLCITSERWLDRVRRSFSHADPMAHVCPKDPSDPDNIMADRNNTSPRTVIETTPDYELNPLSMYRLTRKTLQQQPETARSERSASPRQQNGHAPFAPGYNPADVTALVAPVSDIIGGLDTSGHIQNLQPANGGIANPYVSPVLEGIPEPTSLDLNELPNFFEWDAQNTFPPLNFDAGNGFIG